MSRKFHHAITDRILESAGKADFAFGFGPVTGTPRGYLPQTC